ncbi:adenosylcobinamide-GDP ribazoletransferase [Peribacillus sp. SCS-26]|uniref:adenosylcobinamide-GDP ribazoletransferase n=1 Tax=Paraperibacillus marinus TaxID=3115295 RepID=UPI003906709D
MKSVMHGFGLAFQFLTRIPVHMECEINTKTIKWALRFFGAAGMVLGLMLAGVLALFQSGLPPILMTLLLVTVPILYTGGLHLDGLMDLADAAGSNQPMEKKREILKDPRTGSFGVIACLLLLAWKAGLLYTLTKQPSGQLLIILAFIPILARLQALWLLFFFEPFKREGLAFFWRQNLAFSDILLSLIWTLPFILLDWKVLLLIVLQFLATYLYGRWAVRTLGGINGDVVGGSIEGAELWNLAAVSAYFLYATV